MPTLSDHVTFVALGVPGPSGSKRALRHRYTGKIVLIDSGGAKTKAWRSVVAAAARKAMADIEVKPPYYLAIEFRMPRPKCHYSKSGDLLPGAPWVPVVKPDLTKLLRATEDALTGIVWKDDSLVVETFVSKTYALSSASGARITVCHVESKNGEGKDNIDRAAFFDAPPLQ